MGNDSDLEVLMARIPACRPAATPNLRCCCGRTDCAYLKHNSTALDDLEHEVRTAAHLGQALLVRHEQHMADAERERLDMGAKIQKLETDMKALEDQNSKTLQENKGLLDQVDDLNGMVAESETHIKSLEATLQSTHQELRRLEGLASRTHELEVQFAALEQEQELLQRTITTTEDQERSAIQRWKTAERRLLELQEQLERIEREAQEERERHVEVMDRMERQRNVEKELHSAPGRLNGNAAVRANTGKNGGNVVSHFVKDILQDNANLQLGIVELREMLMNSNDEVQLLREQLLLHQPLNENMRESDGPPTLRAELAPKEEQQPQVISQALHIHHHYHTPVKEDIRRPKKKRTPANAVIFTPPKRLQLPKLPRTQETAGTILSQTSISIPSPITTNNRWSMQSAQLSDFAPSSVPSSPQSIYRNSTLFDRGFELDSSQPTSPGSSLDPLSPQLLAYRHRKRTSEVSTRSFAGSANFQPDHVIHEEDDDVDELHDLEAPTVPSLEDDVSHSEVSNNTSEEWIPPSFQRTLHRSTSHESILSISGIDIHTLKSRPSQITITGGGAILHPQSRRGTPSSMIPLDTLTSSSLITARPTLSRNGHESTTFLRSSIANSDTQSIRPTGSNEGLGKKVGGWVFGRWGVTPAPTRAGRPAPVTPVAGNRAVSTPAFDPLKAVMGRPPGINQVGPIPGFKTSVKAPCKVTPDVVDQDALTEIFSE